MASIQKKTVKGIDYWYLIESKRVNGKPKTFVLDYYGNTKSMTKHFLDILTNKNRIIKSFSHGDSHALMKMAKKIGIEEILDDAFKNKKSHGIKRSTSLILAAIHRVCKPGSKNEFAEWFKDTTLPQGLTIKPEIMTSQHFWEQMDNITEEELRNAEDAITGKILKMYHLNLDKIALDYTNYFTYVSSDNENSTLAKRGRNKQKRYDLKQCSLAIITTKESGLPLFSHVYAGNINDQTEFREYTKLLKERLPDQSLEEITLVFDGGSNTKENLNSLTMHYICSFSLSYCKGLYDIDIADYGEARVNNKMVRCHRIKKKIWGRERICILTFSGKLYDGQKKELNASIAEAENELKELNDKLNNKRSRIDKSENGLKSRMKKILNRRHISDIIQAEIKENKVTYKINDTKKEEIMHRYFGKKLTITDRGEWETEKILKTYYEQDAIEKIFRDTKNTDHFSMQPIYHWHDQKIRVHIFICLLGLTLATVLQKELQDKGIIVSKDRLIGTLSGIRECWISDNDLDMENKSLKINKKLEYMNEQQENMWKIIEGI